MTEIKLVLTALISGIAYLLGGWDNGLKWLIIAVCVDYAFGILHALYIGGWKNIDPRIGFRGFIRKIGYFGAVAVAVLIENIIGQPESIHNLLCYGFAINEAFSVIRNLKDMGVPIPDIFYKQVEDLNKGGKSDAS